MAVDLKDILSNLSADIDQETLLLYLQDKLSPEKRHELEKILIDDEFNSDALEGLAAISDKKKIPALTEQLNRDLARKLEKKNQRRKKANVQVEPWLIMSVLIILALIVIAYFVLKAQMRS